MLDQRSMQILKILQKECHGPGYKIVEKSDILSAMPPKQKISEETLNHIITFLERNENIHIKYDDENVYCLCVLTGENQTNEKEVKIKKEKPQKWLFLLLTVIFSLIGSFLGSIIAKYVNF